MFAIAIFATAYLTAFVLRNIFPIRFIRNRNTGIDSLRGFLAIAVFIHHASLWYQYLHINIWTAPPSNLYNILGKCGVALFFMITAFLFITKLLNNKNGYDWKQFFRSRFFRLFPLYYLSVGILVIIAMYTTGWHLQVRTGPFLESILNWLLFTLNKNPDINKSTYTLIINAGVVWSLPYEWLFYFTLPLIAWIIMKIKTPKLMLAISLAFIVAYVILHRPSPEHLYAFICGSVPALMIKYRKPLRMHNGVAAAIVALCLALLLCFKGTNNPFSLLLLMVIFIIAATGQSLFGVFKNRTWQFLGDISYSTYLLHGFVYFICFYFIFGLKAASALSPQTFCMTVFALTPILVTISFISFRFIEQPFINRSKMTVKDSNTI